MADWLLYEHDDGRHAVAPSAEAATFANGDPKWHRVGPVEMCIPAGGWDEAERIRDLPAVDDAIRNFLIDSTGTNSTCMVREVMRAFCLAASADVKDAARYRWLRQQHWNEAPLCVVVQPRHAVKLGHDCPALDRLDAAIDEAMATAGAGGSNAC